MAVANRNSMVGLFCTKQAMGLCGMLAKQHTHSQFASNIYQQGFSDAYIKGTSLNHECSGQVWLFYIMLMLLIVPCAWQAYGKAKILLVDNIAAFYWLDRAHHSVACKGQHNIGPEANSGLLSPVVPLTMQRVQSNVADGLKMVSNQFQLIVAMSKCVNVTVQQLDNCNQHQDNPRWTYRDMLIPQLEVWHANKGFVILLSTISLTIHTP